MPDSYAKQRRYFYTRGVNENYERNNNKTLK